MSPSIGDVSGDEIDSVIAAFVRCDNEDNGDASGNERSVPSAADFVDMEAEESDGQERYIFSYFVLISF